MHLKQKHPHLRVVLSIGGGNSSEIFPLVASSTLLRDNFARSAKGLVEASGLDGIDSRYRLKQVLSADDEANNDSKLHGNTLAMSNKATTFLHF